MSINNEDIVMSNIKNISQRR